MFDVLGFNIWVVFVDEYVVEGNKKVEYVMVFEEEVFSVDVNEEEEEIYVGDVSL